MSYQLVDPDFGPCLTIAQYQGRSLVSLLIRGQTRSPWSHSAAVLHDESVIESWHRGGVSHVDNLSVNHTAGTPVDIFRVKCTEEQMREFEAFLLSQEGCGYDYWSVFRFLIHRPAFFNYLWFCSELLAFGAVKVNRPLLSRIRPSHVSPKLLGISNELKEFKTVVTI